MASRLTGAVGVKEGPTARKGRVSSKGLFLQTQPFNTSNQVISGPWPRAQLHQQQRPVQNLVPLIKQGTMVFYHVQQASNMTLLHLLSPNTTAASQFGTINTLTPSPSPPAST